MVNLKKLVFKFGENLESLEALPGIFSQLY